VGIALYLHQEKIDSAETNGLSLFDLSTLLAVYIRQGRRDRILRGQAAARALSIRFGRPPLGKWKVEKAKRELTAWQGRTTSSTTGRYQPGISLQDQDLDGYRNVDPRRARWERSTTKAATQLAPSWP
jgi:hypothetical protein